MSYTKPSTKESKDKNHWTNETSEGQISKKYPKKESKLA